MCAKTRVNNLLNHTPPTVGASGSTKQVWGLLEQDSIYGQLWRLISSLHDMYNKYISTNRITTHYTLLCHTGHNRPDGDRRQAHAYPRQRLSEISFRHACKAHEDDYHHKYIHSQQQGKSLAFMQMIVSPHKITSSPKWGGVINVSTNTPKKYYAGVQNACLQGVERQGALQNFWKFSSLSLQSPILK